jgi:hypothetical protein
VEEMIMDLEEATIEELCKILSKQSYGIIVRIPDIYIQKTRNYFNCDEESACWTLIKKFADIDLPGTSPNSGNNSEFIWCDIVRAFHDGVSYVKIISSKSINGLPPYTMEVDMELLVRRRHG